MSLEALITAALLGVTAYPCLGNALPNQRKNALGAMGTIFQLMLTYWGTPPILDDLEKNIWFALITGASGWLFTMAYLNRMVGLQQNDRQHLLWPVLCFVCLTVGAYIGSFESIILANSLLALVLVHLIMGYKRLHIPGKIKALSFAGAFLLAALCVQLEAQGIVVSDTLPYFTKGVAWTLAIAAVLHMVVQDRTKMRNREIQTPDRRIETAAMQIAYKSRRLLKDFRHDLRQPLSTLGILASVGKAIAKDPEVTARYQHIQTAQKALKQMMEEFFVQLEEAFQYPSSDQFGPLKPVRLRDVIEPLVEEYRLLANAKGLELRYSPSLHEGLTHVESLTKILRNGLDNAIKYTERGGVVIGVRGRGKKARIQIIDTGPGVHTDPANQVHKGWGHGSTIVQELSEQIQAHTECKNRVVRGQVRGSVFQVSLPSIQDRQLLSLHEQKRSETGLIARVLAPSKESLECAQSYMPMQHFDQIEFERLRNSNNHQQTTLDGHLLVYVFYAGSEQESSEALRAVEGIQSHKQAAPCLVTVCPATPRQRKSVVFKDNAIHIAYRPGEPEQGFKVLSELFPVRGQRTSQNQPEEHESR
ncbi:sensor histidine kinase [Limnobacter humi]|uniref:histidine kinase n=1 Tax=Limnobacter humi TaxID=1778671 RepID=A0ABT1WH51_9BURK|nr:sensor histidine kinase [Limnobacter humi]MCQ8896851.1 sensor histidine kinase [Limnobacter humi]